MTALGASLRWLSRFQWIEGDRPGAEASAREASDILSSSDDQGLHALALSNEAQLAMLAHDLPRTIDLASRAVSIAREVGAQRALSHALNNLGTAHLLQNRDDGIDELVEAAEVAAAGNFMDDAARAHVNLVWTLLDQYRLDLAERYLAPALEFSERAEVVAAVDLPAGRTRSPAPRSSAVGRGSRHGRAPSRVATAALLRRSHRARLGRAPPRGRGRRADARRSEPRRRPSSRTAADRPCGGGTRRGRAAARRPRGSAGDRSSCV